ncbi:archaemetzincin-2 isoform X3 [Ictalurus punctatus]|uniref:Archaemetzincin-2 n=1 Tax=Ictalurus punctatus TaxID=7998 RepID=A0A9F7RDV8_ICTPU|nr:archaemetzincin-2 isoform X3 [Ictalurus punctatus]
MQCLEHPVEKLRSVLLSTRKDLIEAYEQYSREEKCFLDAGLLPGSLLFTAITVHSDSDWISAHPEAPQDFQSFYSNPYRSTPDTGHKTIYIQTIGSFGDGAGITEQYVEWLREYCEAFYNGLTVKLLPAVTVAASSCTFRVNSNTNNLQLHAGMGVFSFARYDDDFYKRSYAGRLKKAIKLKPGDYSVFQGYYTPPISSILLLRSCKTLTHEIGHIFGIKHCQWLQCVMQGSNHLEESDRRPLDLCPICLRKLQCAIRFKIADRYKALLQWIDNGTGNSDQQSGKPTLAFQDFRQWLIKCLSILADESI